VLYAGVLGPLLRLPHASRFFCGAVAHRGEVLPVFDLARLLGTEDPAAAFVAFVRRAGQTIGLRLAGIEGVRPVAGADVATLDLDALDVPAPRPRPVVSNAAHRREIAKAPPPQDRGLRITLADQAFWLPLEQVAEVLDAAEPVAVPWADPRAPAILMRADEAVAVVRLDLLLRPPATQTPAGAMPANTMPAGTMPARTMPTGTVIVCRAGRRRVAVPVDSVEGLIERGATPRLELETLLEALPGAHRAAAPPPEPPPQSETAAHLAIVLAAQPCLLPLRSVRSVAAHVRPTALPGAPPNLVGVRAMGGQILPVVDARGMLRLPDDEPASVDVEVVPPDGPAFVLAVQQLDGIVRLAATEVHATGLHFTGGPVGRRLPGNPVGGGLPGDPVGRRLPGNPVGGGLPGNPVSRRLPGNPVSRRLPGDPVGGGLPGNPVSRRLPGNPVGEGLAGGGLRGREAVGGVVRLGGRLAWMLIPSALAPRFGGDQ
jgi:chemotaxis signal transduction protein